MSEELVTSELTISPHGGKWVERIFLFWENTREACACMVMHFVWLFRQRTKGDDAAS